jgi:hypothetical protein
VATGRLAARLAVILEAKVRGVFELGVEMTGLDDLGPLA